MMRNFKWQIIATAMFTVCCLYFCNAQAAYFSKADIDKELKAVQNYDYQMTPEPLHKIEEMVRQCHGQEQYRQYLEQQMIELLNSDATIAAKQFICQQLWIIGSAESVPALRKMLTEQETVEMACFALRANPSPQAAEALHEGLTRARGKVKIQIINMLGQRRDPKSIPVLEKLLLNNDEAIVLNSAIALGKIGGKDAIEALAAFRLSTNPEIRVVVEEAYLQYAKFLVSNGNVAEALSIYNRIIKKGKSKLIRRAALLGIINNVGGQEAVSYTMSTLRGDDSVMKAVVIANSHLLKGQQFTRQLVAQLPALNSFEKSLLIDALTRREIAIVRPVITEMCENSSEEVRMAALKSLGTMGDASSVKHLCKAVLENRSIKEEGIALASLMRIKG
ncbi:MAG: HEAT repeat domain-containing protein, partial [Planctomycetota bacterium]